LITGRKRDIQLLERVSAQVGDRVTVLDISMRSNLTDLQRVLSEGASVLYFDHHNAGEGVDHPNLEAHINTAGEICTAVLVDQYLEGAHRAWAVAASYGDNFPGYADDFRMAKDSSVLASDASGEIRVLPGAAASRRISGMFGNQLAQENPDRAHAILTEQDGGFLVSIRAPISEREGADKLALQFDTGGGRAAAAGINHLQTRDLDRFVEAFRKAF